MAVHILGIRHHGVGSAKQLEKKLQRIQPDLIFVEGAVEIESAFDYVGAKELVPPAAIMVYNQKNPKQATFYPYSVFSPEWVAMRYANEYNVPLRAMDLPAAVSFQLEELQKETIDKAPLTSIAESAGFEDGEDFWNHHFEQKDVDEEEHFEKVLFLMRALREEGLKSSLDQENHYREAYMRMLLQQAQNEMYQNIVVVCGAWHAPALEDIDSYAKEDKAILKKLPKKKMDMLATWIPWTNGRLSMYSGYGAGIMSPGWYEHLWQTNDNAEMVWLGQAANVFREEGIDISTAYIIESFRLCRSLAQIRNHAHVQLTDMNDAILSVMCMGEPLLLGLVNKHLIVGEKMGAVPDDIPKIPLQSSFEARLKKLRLKLLPVPKQHTLDLRKEIDRERSILFHRMEILESPWCEREHSRSRGTFKEVWELSWSPEMMINLLDKAYLGNTIEDAAQQYISNKVAQTNYVSEVAKVIEQCIPAALYEKITWLLDKINELSSNSSELLDLMEAVPRLVNISRYGDVRKTDLSVLDHIIEQLILKVCIGLGNACYGLDDDNSNRMFERIAHLNQAIKIYDDTSLEESWYKSLTEVLSKEGVHAIIYGCICRLLLDANQFEEKEADRIFAYALSINHPPERVAFWLEGFLRGSGMILIYDNKLWNLVFEWVSSLPQESFMELLPLLRRSFSKFEYGERRQLGEKSKAGRIVEEVIKEVDLFENFDYEAADKIIPSIVRFLNPMNV